MKGRSTPPCTRLPTTSDPDSVVAAKTYALLCEALKESGKVGVGKLVLRDREDVVILSPRDQGLILYKLRYPKEIRKIENVPQLDDEQEIDQEQMKLARHLLDSMSTTMGADRVQGPLSRRPARGHRGEDRGEGDRLLCRGGASRGRYHDGPEAEHRGGQGAPAAHGPGLGKGAQSQGYPEEEDQRAEAKVSVI